MHSGVGVTSFFVFCGRKVLIVEHFLIVDGPLRERLEQLVERDFLVRSLREVLVVVKVGHELAVHLEEAVESQEILLQELLREVILVVLNAEVLVDLRLV